MDHTMPPTARCGATVLRTVLGAMFQAHLALKLFGFGPAATVAFFEGLGLPGWLAYATMAGEAVGGVALILGIQTRIVAVLLIPLIAGTIVAVHGRNGFFFDAAGGGWEYPAVWIAMLLVQALIGDGAAALFPTRPMRRA